MGRGWFGVGILVVFLILALVVTGLMEKAHFPTCALLEQAAEKAQTDAFDKAVELGMEAKSRWEDQWNGTAAVADHSPMDEIDALFAEMEIYAKTGEKPHFAACCQELAQRLQAMAEAHKFNWWNIL